MLKLLSFSALLLLANIGFSGTSACGVVSGFTYNMDTLERPYKLSGFWVKQNTKDIRITYGNNPKLIERVEELKGSLFICLDDYRLIIKSYAGLPRTYAKVRGYRIWLNGEELE